MLQDDLDAVLALPESRSLSVDIAGRLRRAILGGHFGPGERLGEEMLARSMGVSRGPLREALLRLEREGLVIIRRNRGAFVAQLSSEDLEELYTLRVVLEQMALKRAIHRAQPADIAAMEAVLRDMATSAERGVSEQEAAELDLRFHDLIYDAARHRRLRACWTNLRPQIHILLLNRNVAHEDFREMLITSHQVILEAIRAKVEAAAEEILDDHLHGSYERVASSYKHRLVDTTSSPASPDGSGENAHVE
jgi:DNA-binding GntR family transcriptional regulator